MSDKRYLRRALLGTVATVLASSAAYAQVETIIVTAQKRAQDVQTVPIAVSAFSGDALSAAGVRDIQDIQQVSPSLLISTGSGETTGGLARIRGVGTTGNNAGLEGAVGIFIDGVYRNRTATALNDLVDVERVEVLRGPQGTLFGKNTSAGAISIVTRAPSFDTVMEGSATIANLSGYRFTGLISGPLTEDTLAASISGSYNKRDGFVEDVDTGEDYNDRDRWLVRGQALWTPNDNVTVRLIGDYSEKNEKCCAAPYLAYGRHTTIPVAPPGIIQGLAALLGRTMAVPYTGPNFPAGVAALLAAAPPNHILQDAQYQGYKISVNSDRLSDTKDWGFSGQIDWDFGDETSFTSITAYREFEAFDVGDVDYSPADILGPNPATLHNTFFSEEVQLKGANEWLEWLIGAFYSRETIEQFNSVRFGTQATEYFAQLLQPAAGGQISACIRGLANAFPGCAAAPVWGPFYLVGDGYTNHFDQSGTSWSIFTQNTIHLDDEFSITGGVRYNHEKKNGLFDSPFQANTTGACGDAGNAFLPISLRLLCPRAAYDRSFSESAWTGTGILQWQPDTHVMFYASYSHGYKAGGYNLDRDAGTAGGVAAPAINPIEFMPETVDSYEAGVKSTLFDGMLTANLTVFTAEYQDYQVNTFGGLGFTISNAGTVESDGFEFEMVMAPADGLVLTGGVTYAESEYGEDVVTPGYLDTAAPAGCGITPAALGGAAPPVGPKCLQGRTITQAPKWTFTGSIAYETPVMNTIVGFFGINANYRSQYNTGSNLADVKIQHGFMLANGRVGLRTDDDAWQFEVWGRNLLDKHYMVVAFDSVAQSGNFNVFPGEPATYGVTLTMRR